MLDPALRRLIWMLAKSTIRNIVAKAKTPKGALVTLGLGVFLAMTFGPTIAFRFINPKSSPLAMFDVFAAHAPFLLFCAAAIVIVMDLGKGLLDLRPPELQFVLAGPFTNSQLLTYRLCNLAINYLWVTFVFMIVFVPPTNHPVATMLGACLSGVFVLSLGLIRTLLTPVLTPRMLDAIRIIGWLTVSSVIIEFSVHWSRSIDAPMDEKFNAALDACYLMPIVGFPFRPFGYLMGNSDWTSLIANFSIAILMCATAIGLCYQVNQGFAELAVEGVARKAKKLERMRRGQFSASETARDVSGWRLPMLPWFGGAGSIAWSQLVLMNRRFGKLLIGLMIIAMVALPSLFFLLQSMPTLLSPTQRAFALPVAMVACSYLGFILLVTGQLGFTSQTRQLFWYQQLPLPGFAVGTGMLAGMVAVLVVIRLAVFSVAAVASSMDWSISIALLMACLSADLAFATALNLVSGCTRFSPVASGTPDVFQIVRGMAFVFLLGLVFAAISVPAMIIALPLALLTGPSWTSAGWSVAIGILVLLPPLWWVTGQTFAQRELELSES
ncbi:MAG: putative ABC exporter domain-containing protein [Planctomycetota bacterium]